MPYVKRDAQGTIVNLTTQSDNVSEWLESSDPEIIRFLNQESPDVGEVLHALSHSDAEMIRVIEDLIDILIDKQVLRYNDLPDAVRRKIDARSNLRITLNNLGGLLVDKDDIL